MSAEPAVRAPSLARTLVTCVRRELWEYRILWAAPLVLALFLVGCALFVHIGPSLQFDEMPNINPAMRAALLSTAQWALGVPEYLVMALVLNFYLVDCLYAERRDRSILFWKSLPVSDAMTVGAKFLVGAVLVPLGVYLLCMVTGLCISAILLAQAHLGRLPEQLVHWDFPSWLMIEATSFVMLVAAIAWYAPLAAYLMLVSAWARRSPFMWSMLLPLFVVLLEKWTLGTDRAWELIEYRCDGVFASLAGTTQAEARLHDLDATPGQILAQLHLGTLFVNMDLWLGVLAAVAMVALAVYIRRYRDDA